MDVTVFLKMIQEKEDRANSSDNKNKQNIFMFYKITSYKNSTHKIMLIQSKEKYNSKQTTINPQ